MTDPIAITYHVWFQEKYMVTKLISYFKWSNNFLVAKIIYSNKKKMSKV
jgi:hypothetical protein